MFDEHNPTVAEEVVGQEMESVLLMPETRQDEARIGELGIEAKSIEI